MMNMPVIMAAVIGFGVTALLGFWLIPLLRKLKYGQTILDIGPKWHIKKQGVPTMGGILFAVGITVAVLAGFAILLGNRDQYQNSMQELLKILLGLVVAVAFGVIGYIDDHIKVVKKRNLGLTAQQKLVGMFLVAGLYILGLYLCGDTSTIVFVPFLGQWNLGLFYYPLAIVGIVYMVNVVNINDGIDGLCGSITFIAAIGFLVIASILHSSGMAMFAAALAGGCIGFLVWNFHPARIFMGDTGSFFLGGCVVAVAFGLNIPVFLVFLGIIYIIEGLTVMLQTTYFKLTRKLTGTPKRLFKMAPIHHHFEMCGWSEGKIVAVFSIIQILFTILAVVAAMQL